MVMTIVGYGGNYEGDRQFRVGAKGGGQPFLGERVGARGCPLFSAK
jgi:hypothetical protein